MRKLKLDKSILEVIEEEFENDKQLSKTLQNGYIDITYVGEIIIEKLVNANIPMEKIEDKLLEKEDELLTTIQDKIKEEIIKFVIKNLKEM